MPWSLRSLADAVGAEIQGDPATEVNHVAAIDRAGPGSIAFLLNRQYRRFLAVSGASALVVAEAERQSSPGPTLIVRDPYLAYARIAALLHPPEPVVPGVHPTAIVSAAAVLGTGVQVDAQCVIEARACIGDHVRLGAGSVVETDVSIGDYSEIGPRVVLRRGTRVGRRCLLHPGAVIGADGFGLARDQGRWVKIPQLGSVHIGDDVEIGANTTIDRGALRDTVIEDGVKIDNLVQVGHNAHIGAHSALAGCVGVSGSARLGRGVMLGGGVGISGHLSIADNVVVTGMSLVTRSIAEPGVYSSGWPAREAKLWRRTVAKVNRLDSRRQPLPEEGSSDE